MDVDDAQTYGLCDDSTKYYRNGCQVRIFSMLILYVKKESIDFLVNFCRVMHSTGIKCVGLI